MTSATDVERFGIERTVRRLAGRAYAFVFTRQRPVLAEYHVQRSPIWKLLANLVLLGVISGVAMFYGLAISVLPINLMLGLTIPLVVLALLVIWALPEALRPPVKTLRRTFFVFFVLMLVWPNYLAIALPGLPWLSLRRLVGGFAALLFLVNLSISKQFRNELSDVLKGSPWIARGVMAFAIVQVISTFIGASWVRDLGRMIDYQITWTVMFFVSAWFFANEENRAQWFKALFWVTVILVLIGLAEYRVQHVLWADYIPSFLKIDDPAVQEALKPHFRERYRATSTFPNYLSYGEILALMVPFAIYQLSRAKTPVEFLVWLFADLMLLLASFASGARLALIGFIVAHAGYFLLWGYHRWRTQKSSLFAPILLLAYPALLGLTVFAVLFVGRIRLLILGGGEAQASSDARRQQFELAIPAVSRRPFFGYGPGEGGPAIGWTSPGGNLSIDSGYLSMAGDYGLVGFTIFFGMFAFAMVQSAAIGLRARQERFQICLAISVAFAVMLTTRLVLSQPENYPLMFILLGLSVALASDWRKHVASQPVTPTGAAR